MLPVGDLAVRKAFKRLYGVRLGANHQHSGSSYSVQADRTLLIKHIRLQPLPACSQSPSSARVPEGERGKPPGIS